MASAKILKGGNMLMASAGIAIPKNSCGMEWGCPG